MADLERMGRELKCPICWSLLDSAVSLTCNHLFCSSCIFKSMKSASDCPVCKIPFSRREVRPAPHMDNLVSIYRNMEAASGMNLFVTQNAPVANLSDKGNQCEGDADSGKMEADETHKNHAPGGKILKKKKSRKKTETGTKGSGSDPAKPSFPAKKRVQVPQNILSETPLKNLKLGEPINKAEAEQASAMQDERPLQSEKHDHGLSPFFWLREEKEGDKLSQRTDEDKVIDCSGSTPNPPSFSDLKDSDDESPSNVAPLNEVQNKTSIDLFDSEMFEWTQRPCSPELFSSPCKMQVMDTYDIDENQEELGAASHELEANQPNVDANDINVQNPNKGNTLTDGLPLSVSSQIRSSRYLSITKKSTKRHKITKQGKIGKQKNSIDATKVELGTSSKVAGEQASDNKYKSSNVGRTNRRAKRVCFSNSTNPTSQTACMVSHEVGVQSNDKNQDMGDQRKMKRSRKQRMDSVQDLAEDLSSILNQTKDFAGPYSCIASLQMDNEGKIPDSGQSKSMLSRKSMACSKDLRTTKRPKLSSDCISKTTICEGIQPNESIHQGPDVSVSKDISKEKHSPLTDETVLRKCQSHDKMYECVFCLSSEESEASGPMVHYFDGKPVSADYEGGLKVTHCHRNCAEWAPNVYFEDDNAVNLEAEISRSRRIKCSLCGLKGAALGCYEKTCRRSFHVPCAKWTSRCRWDMENFVMLCPLHATATLPIERSGSQKRKKKCTDKEGNKQGGKRNTESQSRTSQRSYKKIVLCCSALSALEKEVVSEFERVFKVTVLKNWDSSVTHVIASTDENGACKRTLKVLLGILEGKWILNVEWIRACMKEMVPVDEEHYEINVDIHGIKGGPCRGRQRVLKKQPKIFDGYKFYFIGNFIPSYKGYLQDLVVAAGGIILHRKPVSADPESDTHPYQTLIIYSLELPDKCNSSERETIFIQRRRDAEVLASCTGSKVASNTWILNSIAACKLQYLAE